METYTYRNRGVCSRSVTYSVDEDGCVHNAYFIGGCSGTGQGLCALVEGMHVSEVIDRLEGIDCGGRGTSCPDQFAQALIEQFPELA